jgi:hypothetical protein
LAQGYSRAPGLSSTQFNLQLLQRSAGLFHCGDNLAVQGPGYRAENAPKSGLTLLCMGLFSVFWFCPRRCRLVGRKSNEDREDGLADPVQNLLSK